MNRKILIVLVAVLFANTGCVRLSYPRAPLESAYAAIQHENLRDFQQTLAPELAKSMGNVETLQKLRAEFAAFQRIGFGKELLVRRQQGTHASGYYGDVLRVYSEEIEGKSADSKYTVLHTATVTCNIVLTFHPSVGDGEGGGYLGGFVEEQNCLISDFK